MMLRNESEARLMVVLEIIQQLMTTRKNKLFSNLEINASQFGLLSHFTHKPTRSWTISDLANVMEMNQPGITKLVAALSEKGAISVEYDKFDKRKRHLSITDKGMALYRDSLQRLQPEVSLLFSELAGNELQDLLKTSEKLMKWLDNNRL